MIHTGQEIRRIIAQSPQGEPTERGRRKDEGDVRGSWGSR